MYKIKPVLELMKFFAEGGRTMDWAVWRIVHSEIGEMEFDWPVDIETDDDAQKVLDACRLKVFVSHDGALSVKYTGKEYTPPIQKWWFWPFLLIICMIPWGIGIWLTMWILSWFH